MVFARPKVLDSMSNATAFLPRFLLLALLSGATGGMAKIVITLYALSLGANTLQVGIISSMEALGMLMLTLPAGFAIARFGARLVYALSSMGPMLINLLMPLYAVWWWLALGQLLIGLFIPFRIVAMNSAFLQRLAQFGAAKAGWYRGALTLGVGGLGPLLGNLFSEHGHFDWAFYLIAASFAAMGIYSLGFWENQADPAPAPAVAGQGMLRQVRALLVKPDIGQVCLVEASAGATASLFSTFVILLALQLGLAQTQAVSLVMIQALCAVLALFGLGHVLRRLSSAVAYALGFVLATAALLLAAFATTYWPLAIAAALLSFAASGLHWVNMVRLSQSSEDKSKLSGLFNLASMAGSFGGTLLGGGLSYLFGLEHLFLSWIPLLLGGGLLCAARHRRGQETRLPLSL